MLKRTFEWIEMVLDKYVNPFGELIFSVVSVSLFIFIIAISVSTLLMIVFEIFSAIFNIIYNILN